MNGVNFTRMSGKALLRIMIFSISGGARSAKRPASAVLHVVIARDNGKSGRRIAVDGS